MGANSKQGVALLVFLVSFTFLGCAMFFEGNVALLALFAVTFAVSLALLLKAKPLEYSSK